mmetsp:Transcript_44695/g.118588  ORF Transcript_44695/g.118588 Transcript_44695/m.118588 type:complete len:218 (-) Transcript_44695:1152-1805(-)
MLPATTAVPSQVTRQPTVSRMSSRDTRPEVYPVHNIPTAPRCSSPRQQSRCRRTHWASTSRGTWRRTRPRPRNCLRAKEETAEGRVERWGSSSRGTSLARCRARSNRTGPHCSAPRPRRRCTRSPRACRSCTWWRTHPRLRSRQRVMAEWAGAWWWRASKAPCLPSASPSGHDASWRRSARRTVRHVRSGRNCRNHSSWGSTHPACSCLRRRRGWSL